MGSYLSVIPLLGIATLAFPTNGRAQPLSAWSGSLPRPVLFVHGINSDMGTWGISPAYDYSMVWVYTGTQLASKGYDRICRSYLGGAVSKYSPGSAPALLAGLYGITGDGLVPDEVKSYNTIKLLSDIWTRHNTKINHNGIEFYNSMAYSKSGLTTGKSACAEDAYKAGMGLDPFATLEFTDGVKKDSWRSAETYQVGQTDQLYTKIAAVLDEYYSDWKTNPTRRLDIVCHSQGCLATRNVIATFRRTATDNAVNHINTIVSVNSPAVGTALAITPSGVHSVKRLRDVAISLYRRGFLNRVQFKIAGMTWTTDPFKDIRHLFESFLARQHELSYPSNFSNSGWQPASSVLRSLGTPYGSSLMSKLQVSPVTRPMDNSKIPLTALYGTVPGLARKLFDFATAKGYSACNEDIGPFSVDDYTFWTTFLIFRTCTEWINYVNDYMGPIFYEMDQDWTPYSDFIVDVASQQYLGKFSRFNHPFVSRKLTPFPQEAAVPHMNMEGVGANEGILQGATMHGQEIVDALRWPPSQLTILPVFTLLQ